MDSFCLIKKPTVKHSDIFFPLSPFVSNGKKYTASQGHSYALLDKYQNELNQPPKVPNYFPWLQRKLKVTDWQLTSNAETEHVTSTLIDGDNYLLKP